MKTEEDEAFDDLARKQGMWGGGFQAKRAAAADKCQGMNCQKSDVNPEHSLECEAEHAATIAGGHFVKTAPSTQDVDYWIREATAARQAEMAMRRELEAQPVQGRTCKCVCHDGCAACKQMAQPAQEPVALVIDGVLVKSALPEKYTGHLYTTPPLPVQREWVGLTPEETSGFTQHEMTVVKYVSKVLQEKNG